MVSQLEYNNSFKKYRITLSTISIIKNCLHLFKNKHEKFRETNNDFLVFFRRQCTKYPLQLHCIFATFFEFLFSFLFTAVFDQDMNIL